MSQPASGNLHSNKKCHGAPPAKGDGLWQENSQGMDWPLKLAVHFNKHVGLGPTQPHLADIAEPGTHGSNQWSCGKLTQQPTYARGAPTQLCHVSSEFLICQLPFWKELEERLGNQKVWALIWKGLAQPKEATLPSRRQGGWGDLIRGHIW